MPHRYRLLIHPDRSHQTFRGEEVVELEVMKSVKSITLHSAELVITLATLKQKSLSLTPAISYAKEMETVTFSFAKPIVAAQVASEIIEIVGPDNLTDSERATFKMLAAKVAG